MWAWLERFGKGMASVMTQENLAKILMLVQIVHYLMDVVLMVDELVRHSGIC